MPEEDDEEVKHSRNFQTKSVQSRILIGIAGAQWWSTIGSALFAAGIVLIALAYATIKIITSVPATYVGTVPAVSGEAYGIGIIVAAVGLAVAFYGRYKLEKLAWMK